MPPTDATPTDTAPAAFPDRRLLSLDTLRGFDMFWIIGGDAFMRTLARVTDWKAADVLGVQLTHVQWEGLRAYDMVFPLFMFISGVAIPYAIGSRLERGVPKRSLYAKVIIRAIVLFLLGLICNRILLFNFGTLRVASVLSQIGFAYLFASVIYLNTSRVATRVAWFVGILAGYAAVQLYVPVPGVGAGVLTPEGCINGAIDRVLLPGRLYGTDADGNQIFDPEGILCIVSATGITLLGALAGDRLRSRPDEGMRNAGVLAIWGAALLGLGLLIAPSYPPIKAAWTTTFNLQAGGISLLLLAAFYLVIDVWRFNRWTFFFRVIGLNSITIYMAQRFIDFRHLSEFFLDGFAQVSGEYGPLIIIAGSVAGKWVFLWYLYRQRIFLRV